MQPDVSFFGFPCHAGGRARQDGGAGYYVVIQEHPTEPRFGLDVGSLAGQRQPPGVGTHGRRRACRSNGAARWGRNAAHMAGITRRLPVRVAIHASHAARRLT